MKKTAGIPELLSQASLQDFILKHESEDEKKLVLQQKYIEGIPSSLIADQIKGRRKTRYKIPSWYKTRGIIYPPSLNLEQSSSETTAIFKQFLIKNLNVQLVCDLTGGFGVDSFFLSRAANSLDYVEPDPNLFEIAQHNHSVLRASNILYTNLTAESFLQGTSKNYDLIFLDPSRRKSQQKVFRLADCEPDVTKLLENLFAMSRYVLIKASPLLDLQQGIKELRFVSEVYVVSVDNECKELLFACKKNFAGEPRIHCVDLGVNVGTAESKFFSFTFPEERSTRSALSHPLKFLYEPNASILKAGAFKLIAQRHQLSKLHPNTHLYTSNNITSHFPGRIFEIREFVKPDKKLVRKFPKGQANILTRNFPLSVEEIKKKTGLKEGGELYLVCCGGAKEKHMVVAERIW